MDDDFTSRTLKLLTERLFKKSAKSSIQPGNQVQDVQDATIIRAAISSTPNAIKAPRPSAFPVFALPALEVPLRSALPPVLIAAIPAGIVAIATYGINIPNNRKAQAPIPSNSEVEASLSALALFNNLFFLIKIFTISL